MPCYAPLTAYQSLFPNKNGKRPLSFKEGTGEKIQIACGQCIGCRLERSRQWAVRCVHEASLHDQNSFITLTFSPDGLERRNREFEMEEKRNPEKVKGWHPAGVHPRDFQLFIKRLRKATGQKIRYYHCGEYGEQSNRPHYHAILFGYDFPDKVLHSVSNGNRLYTSRQLESCWSYGFAPIGSVTFESAAYVARYIMKKQNADKTDKYMRYTDDGVYQGEVHPEYVTMSRRPGIAREWYDQFDKDVFPHDYVIHGGKKLRTPKYYDKLLEQVDPGLFECIKELRKEKAIEWADQTSPDALKRKEQFKLRQIERLERTI